MRAGGRAGSAPCAAAATRRGPGTSIARCASAWSPSSKAWTEAASSPAGASSWSTRPGRTARMGAIQARRRRMGTEWCRIGIGTTSGERVRRGIEGWNDVNCSPDRAAIHHDEHPRPHGPPALEPLALAGRHRAGDHLDHRRAGGDAGRRHQRRARRSRETPALHQPPDRPAEHGLPGRGRSSARWSSAI